MRTDAGPGCPLMNGVATALLGTNPLKGVEVKALVCQLVDN